MTIINLETVSNTTCGSRFLLWQHSRQAFLLESVVHLLKSTLRTQRFLPLVSRTSKLSWQLTSCTYFETKPVCSVDRLPSFLYLLRKSCKLLCKIQQFYFTRHSVEAHACKLYMPSCTTSDAHCLPKSGRNELFQVCFLWAASMKTGLISNRRKSACGDGLVGLLRQPAASLTLVGIDHSRF